MIFWHAKTKQCEIFRNLSVYADMPSDFDQLFIDATIAAPSKEI